MYCSMCNSIYMKANGEMPCQCSTGESIILHKLDIDAVKNIDFARDIFFGKKYTFIRNSFRNNRLPFPDHCARCSWLRWGSNKEILSKNNTINTIELLHIEPSFLCTLDCLCCIPQNERNSRQSPPYLMPFFLFEKMITDLHRSGLKIRRLTLTGRGEPLMNKEIFNMIAHFKKYFPDGIVSMDTNGNVEFDNRIMSCGLDTIIFSIDGATQDTYSRYRRNGYLDKVLNHMRKTLDERHRKGLSSPKVLWKYILFKWNDSPEEIKKSLDLFNSIHPDNLLYVFTTSHIKSPVNTRNKLQRLIGNSVKLNNIKFSGKIPDTVFYHDMGEDYGHKNIRRRLLLKVINILNTSKGNINYEGIFLRNFIRILYF